MNDNLDTFVNGLQEQIFDEAKEVFGEKGFHRWRNPKYNGTLQNCDTSARVTGECGDSMEIFLKFEHNRVKRASYITDGCASSSLSGSFTAELAMGKTPDDLMNITGDAVIEAIGRLPDEDKHCAFLAAETLQEALRYYTNRETKSKEAMTDKNEIVVVNVNVKITVASLRTIVENARKITRSDPNGVHRVDTADKVSQMISQFLLIQNFEQYAKDIKNCL